VNSRGIKSYFIGLTDPADDSVRGMQRKQIPFENSASAGAVHSVVSESRRSC